MSDVYIIISRYSENMAKRQPWYTIKKISTDFQENGLSVCIISSEKELPDGFSGILIKTFSLKDIFFFRKSCAYRLFFLITFPIYPFKKFFTFSPKTLFKNWVDLKRIFILSLVPMAIVLRVLRQSDGVITISNRSDGYLSKYIKTIPYVPFILGNWGCEKKQLNRPTCKDRSDNQLTIGYFGPLYTTRCFDQVLDLFSWLKAKKIKTKEKLITRTDRESLLAEEARLLKKTETFHTCEVVSGFLRRDELLFHLSTVDVLILPFRIVMSELPVVVIEALELGLAVVTTEDSGVSDLVSKAKNCLVLERFSSKNYPKIVDFIGNFKNESFNDIQIKINEINRKAVNKICQS